MKQGVLKNKVQDLIRVIKSGKMLVVNTPFKNNMGTRARFFYLKNNELIEVTSTLLQVMDRKQSNEITIEGVGFDRIGFFLSIALNRIYKMLGKKGNVESAYWYKVI